jgi:hypothetical protein
MPKKYLDYHFFPIVLVKKNEGLPFYQSWKSIVPILYAESIIILIGNILIIFIVNEVFLRLVLVFVFAKLSLVHFMNKR